MAKKRRVARKSNANDDRIWMVRDFRRLRERTHSPGTTQEYVKAWKRYLRFAESPAHARRVETFLAWVKHMDEIEKTPAKIINSETRKVKFVLNLLQQNQLLDFAIWEKFVTAKIRIKRKESSGVRRPPQRRLSDREVRRICTSLKADKTDPRALLMRAVILLIATTGMKTTEICRMQVKNFREKNGNFYFARVLYGYDKERNIPVPPKTSMAIQDWLAFRPVQSPYVFNMIPPFYEDDRSALWTDRRTVPRNMDYNIAGCLDRLGFPKTNASMLREYAERRMAKKDVFIALRIMGKPDLDSLSPPWMHIPLGFTEDIL